MFSGIVRGTGRVRGVVQAGGDRRLDVDAGAGFCAPLAVGASVAVAGVCLTVVERDGSGFAVDVSRETARCTTLGDLAVGDAVNLEPALRASQALDGHLVSGHVDCTGTIEALEARDQSVLLAVKAPAGVMRCITGKGAVCVDGVSLTVNRASGVVFEANLIPHTYKMTTFSNRKIGDPVNIEVDLIARYLDKLVRERGA